MLSRQSHLTIRALCIVTLLATVSCRKDTKLAPAIGEAFAGPLTLNLRAEIRPDSKTVATASHGERLEIVQVRRRFVRVRTPRGGEGWTESRQLLSTGQMEALEALAKSASKMPSQGAATVYSPLNVHTEPNRPSPSFMQLTEGVRVDVLAERLMPRTAQASAPAISIKKPAPPRRVRKPRREPKVPPPPKPAAPQLPSNWRDLSKSTIPPEILAKEAEEAKKLPPPPKVPMEDWALVRTSDGKAGWALARNLVMAIPDEVAQYSEGARITSYFALGDVQDGDELKHHWFWTTIRQDAQPYQFDSFRIFTYVLRKHRYETAYIERGVEGYYPVQATPGKFPKFSLITRGPDGQLYRKHYMMEGYLVRKTGEELYKPPKADGAAPSVTAPSEPEDDGDEGEDADEESKQSFLDRVKGWFKKS